MAVAVALSYGIDGLILGGFAVAGVIGFEVPLLYTAAGLATILLFALLRVWALKHNFGDGEFALTQVIVASALLADGFTLIGGRAVPNGPPAFVCHLW